MWISATKRDLMIEVWEKLDCESVGRSEIESIGAAVLEKLGGQALDSPMVIARLLADEGAILRHSEIMELYVERAEDRPYEPAFRNLLDVSSLSKAARSIRDMDNLRRKYTAAGDKEGLRLIFEESRMVKKDMEKRPPSPENSEIVQWLTIWMQSPEVFEPWLKLRRSSKEFIERFGEI